MLVCCAQTWAALRIWFCQAAAEPNLALKVLNRLLVIVAAGGRADGVPSGTKLMVISSRVRPGVAGDGVGDQPVLEVLELRGARLRCASLPAGRRDSESHPGRPDHVTGSSSRSESVNGVLPAHSAQAGDPFGGLAAVATRERSR